MAVSDAARLDPRQRKRKDVSSIEDHAPTNRPREPETRFFPAHHFGKREGTEYFWDQPRQKFRRRFALLNFFNRHIAAPRHFLDLCIADRRAVRLQKAFQGRRGFSVGVVSLILSRPQDRASFLFLFGCEVCDKKTEPARRRLDTNFFKFEPLLGKNFSQMFRSVGIKKIKCRRRKLLFICGWDYRSGSGSDWFRVAENTYDNFVYSAGRPAAPAKGAPAKKE